MYALYGVISQCPSELPGMDLGLGVAFVRKWATFMQTVSVRSTTAMLRTEKSKTLLRATARIE